MGRPVNGERSFLLTGQVNEASWSHGNVMEPRQRREPVTVISGKILHLLTTPTALFQADGLILLV